MGWIKTEFKLPKLYKRVLVYPDGENVVISKLIKKEEFVMLWEDDDSGTFNLDTVNFWMELPDEPLV